MPTQPTLEVRKLYCIRGERELFTDISFSLTDGEILQAHGANGSGKTTLLRILAGLTQPEQGKITWQGTSITEQMPAYLAELRYLGHLSGIKLELTPLENVQIAAELHGSSKAMTAEQALDEVALYGFENEPAGSLSAGQRRRIGLARLLVSPGRLWLLDEPHTSLDKAGMALLQSVLHRQLEQGGMIILASHTPIEIHETHIHSLQLIT